MDGHVNLRDAARGECSFKDPKSGKQYSLKQKVGCQATYTCLIFRSSIQSQYQHMYTSLAMLVSTYHCCEITNTMNRSHVSACWLTGLGLGTPSRYLARTMSLYIIIIINE